MEMVRVSQSAEDRHLDVDVGFRISEQSTVAFSIFTYKPIETLVIC